MSARLVFVDESERRARYLMCSVTIAPADIGPLRRTMRKLLLPGQSQLHFKNESPRRRRELGGALVELDLDVAVVSKSSEPGLRRADLRDRCLAEVIADAQDRGDPVQMYLESRHHQDEADHASFSRWRRPEPPLNYEHVPGAADPLLWLPDAFAWLAGAGGEWSEIVRQAPRRSWEAGWKSRKPSSRPSGRLLGSLPQALGPWLRPLSHDPLPLPTGIRPVRRRSRSLERDSGAPAAGIAYRHLAGMPLGNMAAG